MRPMWPGALPDDPGLLLLPGGDPRVQGDAAPLARGDGIHKDRPGRELARGRREEAAVEPAVGRLGVHPGVTRPIAEFHTHSIADTNTCLLPSVPLLVPTRQLLLTS